MFTQRQIGIVAYLLGRDGFVSGEQLSDSFDLGKKTLQSELRSIESELADDCRIASGSKGYRIEYLTDTARERLYAQLEAYGGKNSMGIRPSALVLYLLFQEDFISMQQLADGFYLSKTAVALEILTVKRWVERYDGLTLEISSHRGIRIAGAEARKRVYCAKFGNLLAALQSIPSHGEVDRAYAAYLEAAQRVLQTVLPVSGYLIAGEEYREVSRFIAVSILRSRMGYTRENSKACPQNRLLREIAAGVAKITGYELECAELSDIGALLEESSTLAPPARVDAELERRLECMERRLSEITGLEGGVFPDRALILQHLEKASCRAHSGNVASNHYNEDITRRYPLEAHLMFRLIPEYFGGSANKETSYMALFLANGLRRSEHVSVLLVSNGNRSILSQIATALSHCGSDCKIELTVQPCYLFDSDPTSCERYDLLLATEQETLLRYPEFTLIPCVLSLKDEDRLSLLLRKVAAKRRDLLHEEILRRCHREQVLHNNGEELLTDILGSPHDEYQSYHTFGKKYIYVARIAPKETHQIVTYKMEKPIIFRHKRIQTIIFARCPEGAPDMPDFFDVVRELIGKL